jgi:hypothetical protein
MLSFDVRRTRVVLIGLTKCLNDQHLNPLPAAARNISQLRRLFGDTNVIGIPANNITLIKDPRSASALGTQLARIARQAEDCLIVYYAGHGLKARRTRGLFLATTESTEDECEFNALPLENLRLAIQSSPANKKILILDCCFSGEVVLDGMGSDASLISSEIEIEGTFSLASSPPNRLSIAPEGAQYTAFTAELIGTLADGIETQKDFLTLDDIYQEVRRRIRFKKDIPEPQCKSVLDGSKIEFARNHRKGGEAERGLSGVLGNVTGKIPSIETVEELDFFRGRIWESVKDF